MRVVIKPAGIAVLLTSLASLAVLAFVNLSGSPRSSAVAAASAGDNPGFALANGGFEEGSAPIQPNPQDTAKLTGEISPAWFDNSGWADLDAKYQLDSQTPHGGAASQRIGVGKVRFGHVQLAQSFRLPAGKTYKTSLWLRASKESVPVTFGLRAISGGTMYREGSAEVGKEWKRFEVTGTVPGAEDTFLLVIVKGPDVTVWVDDVEMTEVTAPPAPTP